MFNTHSIIVLDLTAAVSLIVLAALSQRLGDALKIPPIYKLFHVAVALIGAAAIIDSALISVTAVSTAQKLHTAANALRCVGGILVIPAGLTYWRWLFTEFFNR